METERWRERARDQQMRVRRRKRNCGEVSWHCSDTVTVLTRAGPGGECPKGLAGVTSDLQPHPEIDNGGGQVNKG